MKFKKVLSLALGAIMALSVSVTALAATYPDEAVQSNLYGQFYKEGETAVSMVQLGVVNEKAKYVYDELEDTYDLYIPITGFYVNMVIASGDGYLKTVNFTYTDDNATEYAITGTVVDDESSVGVTDLSEKRGTLVFEDMPAVCYEGLQTSTVTTTVDYDIVLFGMESHRNSTADFTLSTTYSAYN